MTFFPVIELIDRYAIAKLKFEKTSANQEELDFYLAQLSHYDLGKIDQELDELYNIHKTIWNLESELKSGKEHLLELSEIGRRAIEIRNWNNRRVKLKNAIADKLGCVVKEIKQDHLSE